MDFLNLLSYKFVTIFEEASLVEIELTGVSELVAKIIEKFSIGGFIAIGILLFSLLLKVIPLPLDIYSRASSKKSALKMERMRPELEKLQKQYANNNALYQQKVMALYKKEGYSQFAACLPTIFTLVFFIVVINAFTLYSSYIKVHTFNEMAKAYTDSVIVNENVEEFNYYVYDVKDENGNFVESIKYVKNSQKPIGITVDENNTFKIEESEFILVADDAIIDGCIQKTEYIYNADTVDFDTQIKEIAQYDAAIKYKEISKSANFLWVQNIWIEDLPWKKAFVSKEDYVNSVFSYSKGCTPQKVESIIANAETYDLLTGSSELDDIKEQPNGYLILVILSIGTMLISQLISTKTQKSQMELQSVDGKNGQAAQTTKMMMWMMPIMFGIFSFMYTASFSLYLIVSTVFSTASTLIINFFVEKAFEKKLKQEEQEKYNKRYGHLINKK